MSDRHAQPRSATISYDGRDYAGLPGETVLETLLRGGADINISCRKGSCQTCVLELEHGDPGPGATAGLPPAHIEAGCFLPCVAHPSTDLTARRPDASRLFGPATVVGRDVLGDGVVRLFVVPESAIEWRAGQFVNVRVPDGSVRSYSIASSPLDDWRLELHVRRVEGGRVSPRLCDEVDVGDSIEVQGPHGTTTWNREHADLTLVLIATGTGLAPVLGVARDALSGGHRGAIHLYHGSREPSGLYAHAELRELEARHDRFHYHPCISRPEGADGFDALDGRAADIALVRGDHGPDAVVYVAGGAEAVHGARLLAVQTGIDRTRIVADPFQTNERYLPDDRAKMASIPPDPEIWDALDEGRALTRILTRFYTEVFDDPRIAPFFHGVTRDRAIQKQYEFLADIFTGDRRFFGFPPFNAHHWMIISDELFDYREAIFERHLREFGMPDNLILRWLGIHEMFRREIVKSAPRGIIRDGVEHRIADVGEMEMTAAALCDGCEAEIDVGERATYHQLTGQLFCATCRAARVDGRGVGHHSGEVSA